MTEVLVALIGGIPATIVAAAAWRSSAAGRRNLRSIDRAVNGVPGGELTLVQKVDELRSDMSSVRADVAEVKGRLTTLERRVG